MAPNQAIDKTLVRALIFDLDDTLFDTYGLLIKPASREACEAMMAKGLNATLENSLKIREHLFSTDPRKNIYEQLVDYFGVRASCSRATVIQAGFDAFHNRDIKEKIFLFPDTVETITALKKKFKLYLVTLGSTETQKRKISLLGVDSYFDDVCIVDIGVHKTKLKTFEAVVESSGINALNFVSIGNRIDGEIRDGKQLGMQTILMRHGEYLSLRAQSSYEKPDTEIEKLSELKEILL